MTLSVCVCVCVYIHKRDCALYINKRRKKRGVLVQYLGLWPTSFLRNEKFFPEILLFFSHNKQEKKSINRIPLHSNIYLWWIIQVELETGSLFLNPNICTCVWRRDPGARPGDPRRNKSKMRAMASKAGLYYRYYSCPNCKQDRKKSGGFID